MYEAEIARGMAWLDAERPGWRERLDRTRLDMSNPDRCPLGQEFGSSRPDGTGYYYAVATFDFDPVALGFTVELSRSHWKEELERDVSRYRQLTREWLEALAE